MSLVFVAKRVLISPDRVKSLQYYRYGDVISVADDAVIPGVEEGLESWLKAGNRREDYKDIFFTLRFPFIPVEDFAPLLESGVTDDKDENPVRRLARMDVDVLERREISTYSKAEEDTLPTANRLKRVLGNAPIRRDTLRAYSFIEREDLIALPTYETTRTGVKKAPQVE